MGVRSEEAYLHAFGRPMEPARRSQFIGVHADALVAIAIATARTGLGCETYAKWDGMCVCRHQ